MSTSEFSSLAGNDYPEFGRYIVKDNLVMSLPNHKITCSQLNENSFSYKRETAGEETIKKIIHPKTADFQIGLMPILPVHTPSYKTDFFFMRFREQIYMSQNSSMEIIVLFPIEIGMFLVEEDHSGLIDYFSCDPMGTHFALYGNPEEGKLCKYAQIQIDSSSTQQLFTHAQMKIKIANESDEGVFVGKLVFPVTDHDLHFHKTSVIIDGLTATIKNRIGVRVIDMIQDPIRGTEGWKKAIRDNQKTDYKFSMERGFD